MATARMAPHTSVGRPGVTAVAGTGLGKVNVNGRPRAATFHFDNIEAFGEFRSSPPSDRDAQIGRARGHSVAFRNCRLYNSVNMRVALAHTQSDCEI